MVQRQRTVICQICKKKWRPNEVRAADLIREPIAELIRKAYPDWSNTGYICISDLNKFRDQYVKEVILKGKGELSALEEEVAKSLKEHELISTNINAEFERKLTFGERMSDSMAKYAGSWRFIGIFMFTLLAWIILNAVVLIHRPFDPYPFILLNLILSCIAAIQAPIIMMSQNRQESKDRMRSEYDYRVNLKAELEIRQLHEKIDQLLANQWQRLLEIQALQMDLIQEIGQKSTVKRL